MRYIKLNRLLLSSLFNVVCQVLFLLKDKGYIMIISILVRLSALSIMVCGYVVHSCQKGQS